jgi:hypothetical protein
MKNLNLMVVTIIFLVTAYSCKKAIPENVVTTVKGFVIDTVKNKRLSNAKVSIYGCRQTTFSISCATLITSTRTNSNGDFSINFNSDGKSISFQAEVDYDENFDYSSTVKLLEGNTNDIKLTAREFNYLKTRLIITNNPFDTLVNLSRNTRHIFYGQTLDTTIMNRVLPNGINFIIYSAWDRNVGKYRRLIDTLTVGMQDTINYTRTLPNVNTFPTN